MEREEPLLKTPSGFKRFFGTETLGAGELSIRGVGIRELMPACQMQRPAGTQDHLLMLFHDSALAGVRPGSAATCSAAFMMIWPPGKPQYYGNPDRRFTHSWIHCDGVRVRRLLRHSGLPVLAPFHVPDPSPFEKCLLDIHAELVSYRRPDLVIAGNLLENCVRELSRTLVPPEKQTRIPENLLAARRLMHAALGRPLTLEDLARAAGMSEGYFCTRFKEVFGLSPMEYLIQHRMHHAIHLLANPNLSITEIAAQCGYADAFFFSRMFKKHSGLSPREVRRRQATGQPGLS